MRGEVSGFGEPAWMRGEVSRFGFGITDSTEVFADWMDWFSAYRVYLRRAERILPIESGGATPTPMQGSARAGRVRRLGSGRVLGLGSQVSGLGSGGAVGG
jgi:hypothetical protein